MSDRPISGQLTTHVLDLSSGTPIGGLLVELFRLSDAGREFLGSSTTDADGRCGPLVERDALQPGVYELLFHCAERLPAHSPQPFLGDVPIRFGVDDASRHWHVPLLVSPFGYTTYRGS